MIISAIQKNSTTKNCAYTSLPLRLLWVRLEKITGSKLCIFLFHVWVIEGKIKNGVIEVAGRRGRRRRKLLDDLKERRGYSYLKEEALDRTMWRARFGRGFGPVVRQTAK